MNDAISLSAYKGFLGDLKARIRQAQGRAALAANAELVRLYWDIGRAVADRQQREGWGAGVIPRLAADLKNELPELKGFSATNLKRMVQFADEYPSLFSNGPRAVAQLAGADSLHVLVAEAPERHAAGQPPAIGPPPVVQLQVPDNTRLESLPPAVAKTGDSRLPAVDPHLAQAVAKLPWAHNIALMQMVKDRDVRCWYAEQTIAQGWSRDGLVDRIKARLHQRQGGAVTNFGERLDVRQSSLAAGLLKDPYIFDFLTMEEPFHERELETNLVRHIERFLIELGQGFAFVGRQYPLAVGGKDFHVDLLFYHLKLRCFVVVDLKRGDFKPEHAGKMNFYCSAIDDLMRHEHDNPTIGLVLCQDKDRTIAEYALRGVATPIGVSDYELTRALPKELASSLPSIEQIEAELEHLDRPGER